MVEAKKAGAKGIRKGAKTAPEEAPVQKAALTAAKPEQATEAAPSIASAPAESVKRATPAAERSDVLRQAVSETVAVTARGALEVNDKIIEALETQSHAALDLWRSAINASHLSEAIQVQANGTRHAYETASAQWKDIAETTARWFNKSLEPLQSVLHHPGR